MSRIISLSAVASLLVGLGACAREPAPYAVAEAPPAPYMKPRPDAKYDLESGAPRPGYGRPLPPPYRQPVAQAPAYPPAGYPPAEAPAE